MTDYVAMGYVKGVFGVRGWLRIKADTEYADGLLDYPQWQLHKDNVRLQMAVADGKVVNGELHVKLEGIDTRNAAEDLRGYTVEISREAFEPAEPDAYYWVDLMGMEVINRDDVVLGTITSLMDTGAHDVLVVSGDWGEKLIPFVSQYIDNVQTADRMVRVDWGLDY